MFRMNISQFESLTRLKCQILLASCRPSPLLGHCSPCRGKARLVLALEAGIEWGALETLRRVGGEERERERGEGDISQGGEEGSSRHRLPARGLGEEDMAASMSGSCTDKKLLWGAWPGSRGGGRGPAAEYHQA